MTAVADPFHADHQKLFGYANPGAPIAVNEPMMRTWSTSEAECASGSEAAGPLSQTLVVPQYAIRKAWWPDCPVFARSELDAGWVQVGPALIEHDLATV
ncbi:hypothetical protein ACYCVF_35750 [Bradyrhizobium sp. 1.29L]